MKKTFILLSAFLISLGIVSNAAAYSISYADGTTYNTTALTDYQTFGSNMDGMTVVATFLNGLVDTQIWGDTGGSAGGVSGTGWGLSVAGDTWNSGWPLNLSLTSGVNLASLSIDAGTGNTVFDVVNGYYDPPYSSPDSQNGVPFYTTSTAYINATYSDRVMVNNVFYGDLYRTLSLDFGSNGLSSGFTFYADTDNLLIAGDINPVEPVPEPSTILLMGAGLLGLVGFNRKRFSKKS